MGQNSVGDLEKDVTAVVDSLADHFQLMYKTVATLKSFRVIIAGLVKKYAAQAEQRQFEESCKARPNDMAGFDHSDYERGFTDGVNDYEKAIRQVWKERHDGS